MARPLPLSLDQIGLGNTTKLQPAWKLEIWDTRSGANTIADVVLDNAIALITGPLDVTPYLESVTHDARSGDYIQSGVAASTLSAKIIDSDGTLDPHGAIDDPEALGRFFRRGNVVRLKIGDERVPEIDWVNVFTGRIAGQAGYTPTRVGLRFEINIKAYGREATFIPFERTSSEFKNDGTTYLQMATSVAGSEMGLAAGEFNFGGWGTHLVEHSSVTLAKENPMSMLAKIMLTDLLMPKFDGSGVLTQTSGVVTGNSDRFYETDDAFIGITRPQTEVQPPDAVCVVGLDFNLSRVDQPRQLIAEMNVTTGYFTNGENLEVFWSDDHTKLADNVTPVVLKSVNGGMSGLGGGEIFTALASPSLMQVGTIGFNIQISTGFAPWLASLLLVTHVTLAAFPDTVTAAGVGFGLVTVFGFTFSVGRLAQAISLAAALHMMTKLGRGQYQFMGDPFEYVYSEIREGAVVEGVGAFDRNEVVVENHLVDNRTDAKVIARELLFRQQARGRPRNATMFLDLALEPDDTFDLLASDRRFLVDSIRYTLQRGKDVIANVKCFEVTTNISRAT
jgi:hypothetical protein